jgi:hypothetical protein
MNQHASMKTFRGALVGLSALALGACSDSPLGPNGQRASMQVSATAMTATTLGANLTIDATVVNTRGQQISNADVHWDMSAAGVLEAIGNGHFRVLHEGTVQVAAIWPKDPSVRAAITVTVNASIMASACITYSDQALSGAPKRCAQQRVVVSTAPALLATTLATSTPARARRGQP